MRVESGPAWAERRYWLIWTVALLAYASWFVYDHYIGWPDKNRSEAAKHISRVVGKETTLDPAKLGPRPTQADFDRVKSGAVTDPLALRKEWGDPAARTTAGDDVYASLYGAARVPVRGGRIDAEHMEWTKWYKDKKDIDSQLYFWMPVALLVALYPISKLVRYSLLRVVVDDEGVSYGGKRIPLSSIVSVRDYNRKGWVDMWYREGDAGERKLRLDNQKIKKFDEVVAAICAAKGFANPVTTAASPDEEKNESKDQ